MISHNISHFFRIVCFRLRLDLKTQWGFIFWYKETSLNLISGVDMRWPLNFLLGPLKIVEKSLKFHIMTGRASLIVEGITKGPIAPSRILSYRVKSLKRPLIRSLRRPWCVLLFMNYRLSIIHIQYIFRLGSLALMWKCCKRCKRVSGPETLCLSIDGMA